MTDKSRLMLIDGHALVHRAFHALPESLSTSAGELTNAVFGFSSMLLKAIETAKPTHIIMAFDRPVPTFRHEAYEGYKATRAPTSPALRPQFERVREVAGALNIPIYEVDGFEADDVLGALAQQAERQRVPTIIVTGDLDALQLVTDKVHVMMAQRGIAETKTYTPSEVRERFGLEPEQLPDYKGLVGDTSDNIPGVAGIGGKTASKLLAQYQTLEGLYDHLGELPAKQAEKLEQNRDVAFQSRELATIVRAVPITLQLNGAAYDEIDRNRLINLFRELEFGSLIPRIQALMPRGAPPAPPAPVSGDVHQLSMFGEAQSEPQHAEQGVVSASLGRLDAPAGAVSTTVTRIVDDDATLKELIQELQGAKLFSVDTETTSTDPLRANLVGLSFATRPDHGWYVPVGHVDGKQLSLDVVLERLRAVLEDPSCQKVAHNAKYDYTVLALHGIELAGLEFDTMIAAFLVNASGRNISLSSVAMSRLAVEMTPIELLIGKGKSQITMDRVAIETVASYAGADADITLRLRDILERELEEQGVTRLFREVEMPLVRVLAEMERVGVPLDTRVLHEMSREMSEVAGRLEDQIFQIAGYRFNINSTQQLGQLLFRDLKLPSGRRTKTGHSTDNEVLEGLRGRHEIVDLILEYRGLIKLKNTYVEALPSLIDPRDGRVHTDFNQTGASTGRLSSSNPNLQNIPIRGELGRKIRRAFVPSRPENVLLAVDYSQIELRILASMSHDPRLMEAFLSGEDIHRATAAAVFGVKPGEVTADQRRIAKVVNFGIIYGIGEQRLAHETGITRQEAGQFIASYNQTYAGVKAFMDDMRKRAALYGYVSTLLGRRRYFPDVHSNHPGIRQAAERAAINMPIQGTAADIIKIAMNRLFDALQQRFPEAHMVLQVHDELVFDAPSGDVGDLAPLVREIMEHAVELDVPLEVEMKVGRDWYDLEPLDRAA